VYYSFLNFLTCLLYSNLFTINDFHQQYEKERPTRCLLYSSLFTISNFCQQSEKKDPELPACLIPLEDLKVVKELGEGQYGVVQLGEWKSTQGTLVSRSY